MIELVRRSAWGARPPKSRPLAIAVPVKNLVLHHSVTADAGMETVRQIQKFHQDSRGWNDIAYSWLYSPVRRQFYEGRGVKIAQAAQTGHNRDSHSLCVLGNFDRDPVPLHVIDDVAEWAGWHRDTQLGPGGYVGHRDLGTTATACPGRNLHALLATINGIASGETTPQPSAPEPLPPTIRQGSRGDDVRLAQTAVGTTIDGIFGPQTDTAVRRYQTANGLVADGIVGPKTWEKMLR
jgi:peptidoglycan hydrolase-like protein with peptidoglycan-binding domain